MTENFVKFVTRITSTGKTTFRRFGMYLLRRMEPTTPKEMDLLPKSKYHTWKELLTKQLDAIASRKRMQ